MDGLTEDAGHLTGQLAVRVGKFDGDHEGRLQGGDGPLPTENFLLGERAAEDVALLVGLNDALLLVNRELARHAFDNTRAAHGLDGGKEVVVGRDVEVIICRGVIRRHVRRHPEHAQFTDCTVLWHRLIGEDHGDGDAQQHRQDEPPKALAEHRNVSVERVATLLDAIATVTTLPVAGAVATTVSSTIVTVVSVATVATAAGSGIVLIVLRLLGCFGHGVQNLLSST